MTGKSYRILGTPEALFAGYSGTDTIGLPCVDRDKVGRMELIRKYTNITHATEDDIRAAQEHLMWAERDME